MKKFLGATHVHSQHANEKPKNICQLFTDGDYQTLRERIVAIGPKIPLIEQTIRSREKQPAQRVQKIGHLNQLYNSAMTLVNELCSRPTSCNKTKAKQLFTELQSIL